MRYPASLIAVLSLTVTASGAHAAPPVHEDGHTHHVSTGADTCIDIDAVRFLAVDRGLHRGAEASGARGPGHGGC